ncbi:MAG TPA: tetratricopeptide repeat protein, partial [Phycisphaerae bacterium]
MTKSATSKKQRQVSGPARRASTIKPRARSRTPRTVLAITCIAGVAVVGLGGLRVFQWLRPAPPVVLPAHPDQIEPQVAKLVQQYAERVWAAPRSAEAHATLGLVYEANKMWYEAEACFGRALQLEPGQCLPAHHRAIMLRSLGEFDAALQAWRTLVQRHPEFAPAHVRIGNALLEAGAPAEAAAAFQRAVDLLPDAAEPFVGLAEARLKQGDYSGAISAGETATRLAPRYRMAHYVLGTAYRAVRRSEAAERELTLGSPALDQPLADEWTARLNELAANLSDQIGSAMDFVDAGQPDVGIRLLERALATRPGEVQIMSNLGTAYMMSGQVEKARDVLLRAEKSNNQAFATYINLAACHLELKRYSEALRYADRAIELAPTMGQAHLVRGRILV